MIKHDFYTVDLKNSNIINNPEIYKDYPFNNYPHYKFKPPTFLSLDDLYKTFHNMNSSDLLSDQLIIARIVIIE